MGIRAHTRLWAIALVAFVLTVTAVPVASAEEAPPETSTTTTTAPAPEAAPEPAPAPAAPKPNIKFVPVVRYDVKRTLVFPVVGVSKYWSGFGDCRDNCHREHHGIDILTYGYKGLPVVAAHDGTVTKVTYDEGNAGCSVRIKGRDRWETRYYHLNNDFPGTDEIGAPCPAAGIEVGVQVSAGQIIGYVGDSGNSEHTVPHLHFELRSRSGYPIDPYRSLKASKKIAFEWLPTDPQASTVALSEASRVDELSTLVLVCTDEWNKLGESEEDRTVLDAPVLAVDKQNPLPALQEVARLAPERIIILSDNDAHWLEQLVMTSASIVESSPLTPAVAEAPLFEPDQLQPAMWQHNPTDRFTTLIAGATHKIWRSRRPAYEDFTANHRSIVITGDYWAPKYLGLKPWSSPGKYADPTKLWWYTGDGWIDTDPGGAPPAQGMAYVTEKRAQPWTLSYLGSLAELPPYPVWKSS